MTFQLVHRMLKLDDDVKEKRITRSDTLLKTRQGEYHRGIDGSLMLNAMSMKKETVCGNDPVYFEQAWDHKNIEKRDEWRKAIEKEHDDMVARNVWSMVENVGQNTSH